MRRNILWRGLISGFLTLIACGHEGSALEDFKPCGGSPNGEWSVTQFAAEPGFVSVGPAFDREPSCNGAVELAVATATGTYRFDSDATYSRDASVTFDLRLRVTSACITAVSRLDDVGGIELKVTKASCDRWLAGAATNPAIVSADCSFTGDGCDCGITTREVPLDEQGSYRVTADTLTLNDGPHPFCVAGDRLELKTTVRDKSAVIVLQRN